MKIKTTPIDGVFVVETTHFKDQRGSFARLFCNDELSTIIGNRQIKQINHSHTSLAGTVRGMHLQKAPHAEMKLVRCINGKIWDVAVDLRKDSHTYKQWFGIELSPENGFMLIIPEGCAHGFQALKNNSEMLYLHTEIYHPDSERGVNYTDPHIGIKWPLTISELSPKDKKLPFIDQLIPGNNYEM